MHGRYHGGRLDAESIALRIGMLSDILIIKLCNLIQPYFSIELSTYIELHLILLKNHSVDSTFNLKIYTAQKQSHSRA